MKPKCRHCQRANANRPRRPVLDLLLHVGSAQSCILRRVISHTVACATSRDVAGLPKPTAALPGTPAKVAVLQARARRGHALWHPRDAKREQRQRVKMETRELSMAS